MPSASELLSLYNREEYIKKFIDTTIYDVEELAKNGSSYTYIDVPSGLKRFHIDIPLREAFPGCKITWKWFLQSYQVSWKNTT